MRSHGEELVAAVTNAWPTNEQNTDSLATWRPECLGLITEDPTLVARSARMVKGAKTAKKAATKKSTKKKAAKKSAGK